VYVVVVVISIKLDYQQTLLFTCVSDYLFCS